MAAVGDDPLGPGSRAGCSHGPALVYMFLTTPNMWIHLGIRKRYTPGGTFLIGSCNEAVGLLNGTTETTSDRQSFRRSHDLELSCWSRLDRTRLKRLQRCVYCYSHYQPTCFLIRVGSYFSFLPGRASVWHLNTWQLFFCRLASHMSLVVILAVVANEDCNTDARWCLHKCWLQSFRRHFRHTKHRAKPKWLAFWTVTKEDVAMMHFAFRSVFCLCSFVLMSWTRCQRLCCFKQ